MLRKLPLVVPACALFVVGCGHAPPSLRAVANPTAPPPRSVARASGTWEWIARRRDEQNNVQLEQEEWHLEQKGQAVRGYYDRLVTLVSLDDSLFRCNHQTTLTKSTRVQVAGAVVGDRVTLQEVGFEAKPGPCDDGARNLVQYTGVVTGPTMHLAWGPEAAQTLVRSESSGGSALAGAFGAPADPAATENAVSRPGAAVAGTWEWELKSIDAEGDERIEREEWHLAEQEGGISGYYERTVTRVRADGRFSCNDGARYRTLTRYTIAGLRHGDKVSLAETKYEVPATESDDRRCDNGLRRLDSYQGTVSHDGDEIVLSWGPGNQLLRRAAP